MLDVLWLWLWGAGGVADGAECGWAVEVVSEAPRQHNGYDCGVFLCMYARAIALSAATTTTTTGGSASEGSAAGLLLCEAAWNFEQRDMQRVRQSIAATLHSGLL